MPLDYHSELPMASQRSPGSSAFTFNFPYLTCSPPISSFSCSQLTFKLSSTNTSFKSWPPYCSQSTMDWLLMLLHYPGWFHHLSPSLDLSSRVGIWGTMGTYLWWDSSSATTWHMEQASGNVCGLNEWMCQFPRGATPDFQGRKLQTTQVWLCTFTSAVWLLQVMGTLDKLKYCHGIMILVRFCGGFSCVFFF